MSDLMIAVGGTGQHVALAVSRLIALKALPPMDAMVLDADAVGPLSQRLSSFGDTLKVDGINEPLPHPLQGANKIFPPFDLAANATATFQSLVLQNNPAPKPQLLMQLFFSANEANTNIAQGMYGQPNVGSTVFAIGQQTGMRKLLEGAASANSIYVVGSFIGGTGAGIVHQLVRQLRDIHKDKKKIFGIFLLPWLDTQTAQGTITTAGLDANFRHGCEYFWDETRHHLSASLLLGIPNTSPASRLAKMITIGGSSPVETPSFLHLAAAHGILALEQRVVTDGMGHVYSLALDEQFEQGIVQSQKWNGDMTLLRRAHAAMTCERLLRGLQEESDDFKGGFSWTGAKHFPGLHESVEEHARLAGAKPAAFIDLLNRYFEIHRRQVAFCTQWIHGLTGLPPLDAATEALWKDRTALIASLRAPQRLRQRFPTPPADAAGKSYNAEQLARHLSGAVINALTP